jgi:hypothetical protein
LPDASFQAVDQDLVAIVPGQAEIARQFLPAQHRHLWGARDVGAAARGAHGDRLRLGPIGPDQPWPPAPQERGVQHPYLAVVGGHVHQRHRDRLAEVCLLAALARCVAALRSLLLSARWCPDLAFASCARTLVARLGCRRGRPGPALTSCWMREVFRRPPSGPLDVPAAMLVWSVGSKGLHHAYRIDSPRRPG